jgi:NADH dehydrogenase/NADH:ubiquinone oxidoreductase subunit G
MPIITVDGYELEVKAGTNLLDALLSRNMLIRMMTEAALSCLV